MKDPLCIACDQYHVYCRSKCGYPVQEQDESEEGEEKKKRHESDELELKQAPLPLTSTSKDIEQNGYLTLTHEEFPNGPEITEIDDPRPDEDAALRAAHLEAAEAAEEMEKAEEAEEDDD